ncbi:unnamed protein product [Lampetra planeri]
MTPTAKMLLSRLLLAVRGAASNLLHMCWPASSSSLNKKKCFRRLACHSCVVFSLVSALLLLQASHHVTLQSRQSPSRQSLLQRLRQTVAGQMRPSQAAAGQGAQSLLPVDRAGTKRPRGMEEEEEKKLQWPTAIGHAAPGQRDAQKFAAKNAAAGKPQAALPGAVRLDETRLNGTHGVNKHSAPTGDSHTQRGQGHKIDMNDTGKAREGLNNKPHAEDLGGWWHLVPGTNTYLLSAHLDDRFKMGAFVRILTVSPRKEDPDLCCTHWRQGKRNTTIRIYERELHPAHYSYRYAVHSLLCLIPPWQSPPDRVSVALCKLDPPAESEGRTSLLVHRPTGPKVEFAVCLPMLFGRYDRLLHLLQSVEFYRLLGASLVTVYNYSLGPNVDAALHLYAKAGLANVLPWPVSEHLNVSTGWRLDRNPGDVHYYGQIGCMTDCLYRSAHRARWVFMNDIDEVVVPHAFANWSEMVSALSPVGGESNGEQRFSVFTFMNGIFPLEPHAIYRKLPARACVHESEADVDYLRTLRLVTDGRATKVLVDSRSVVHQGVHRADTLLQGALVLNVPEQAALLHHYKSVGAALFQPGTENVTEDRATLLYREQLLPRVHAMLAMLCAQGGPHVVPKQASKSAKRPTKKRPKT